jgi:serine phosphatase RsbU (regulator of sigma subunit)
VTTTLPSPHPTPGRLASRIDTLVGSFRSLSKSSTLPDLGSQSAGILQELFPEISVELAHRASPEKEWKTVARSQGQGLAKLSALPRDNNPSGFRLLTEPGTISFIQELADHSSLGVVLSRNDHRTGFSELDTLSLRLFAQLFDSAYQNIVFHRNEKALIFSLNHRILQLTSLIETGIEVEKLDHTESPHHLALVRAASLTNASHAEVRVAVGRKVREEFAFPQGVPLRRGAHDPHRIATGFTFHEEKFTFELFDKESRDGIVGFDETDQLLLDALAKQVHASLENRYLHQQALEKQRIEQDMAVAAAIQKKILPIALPIITGYDLAGVNIPSKSVGGDYYDCLPLRDGRHALVIADVSGKGVPAALLVSSLHAYLSAYLEGPFTLPELAARLNNVLHRASPDDKFITAFIAILSPKSGDIEYVNAGHNPAFVLTSRKRVRTLAFGGLPLGMFPGIQYQSDRVTLKHGERLLMYTDGITEAQNEAQDFFEKKIPLGPYFAHHQPESAKLFIDELIRDIKAFTGSAPQSDDITAMSLWRN